MARCGFSLCSTLELRQTQRLELRQVLHAPTPPNAVSGIEGMKIADEFLKDIGVVGMLIGGLAKELWCGVTDEESLNKHKDVDVLILSYDCELHPKQWASGVDWWVSHNHDERPTNGNPVGLLWRVKLESHALNIPKGLYLCPVGLLRESLVAEKRVLKDRKVVGGRFKNTPAPIYPLLDEMQLRWNWANLDHPTSTYCERM